MCFNYAILNVSFNLMCINPACLNSVIDACSVSARINHTHLSLSVVIGDNNTLIIRSNCPQNTARGMTFIDNCLQI